MKNLKNRIKDIFSFIKIDYSFLLMLFLFLILDCFSFYFYYVLFIILHEMSHLMIAKRKGYFPKKIKLTMFGASLEGFDDFLLKDEIKIVLAGPLFNLIIVVCIYLCYWFFPESSEYLDDILRVNQSILFFNLLPIFPLDAGRLLLCFLSLKFGRKDAVRIVKKVSIFFVFVMFFISIISFLFLYNFILGFVSLNLCLLLFESSNGTSYKREILFRKKISRLSRGLPQKVIFIKQNYPENLLLKFLDGEHYFLFVFVNENLTVTRKIDEFELLKKLGFI